MSERQAFDVLVVGLGLVLRKTLWRTMGADPLVIDLPPYQRPTARLTAADVVELDLAYAPPFSSVWDPVQVAARAVLRSV